MALAHSKKPTEKSDGLAVRKRAVHVLQCVLQKKQPLDEALIEENQDSETPEMAQRDKAFARAIVMTSLRRKGQIDDVISRFLDSPLPRKCGYLREILLSAGAQLLFLKTPPHAVIDLSVGLCKSHRATHRFAKLTNAILRRVSEHGPEIIAKQNITQNIPHWLGQRWQKAYGSEKAEKIATALTQEPALDLTLKSEKDAQRLLQNLEGHLLPTGQIRSLTRGRIEDLPGYDEGTWWVQDMAASLPVKLLGDIKNKKVADLCAAPGGKTAQLCTAGADVTAVDISNTRMKRVRENLKRLGLKANYVIADILDWQPETKFDAVLLDAPCSATGTIRRHPDIPYLKSEDDIHELKRLQAKMLERTAHLLKPGGVLVFCTCSLEPEEGIGHISKCLKSNASMRLDPLTEDDVFGQDTWIQDGCLRTFPFSYAHEKPEFSGMDGFFAARFVKM